MPLVEFLMLTVSRWRKAKSISQTYHRICIELGGQIQVLTHAGLDDSKQVCGEDLGNAVLKIRSGQVEVVAGFDGKYGTVRPGI